MDSVNSNQSKVIRGKVKAMIVKINRGSVERPPMPEINNASSAPSAAGGIESLDNDQQVAYLVNKGLDGDMDSVNNFDNKVLRAKAKAMIVKINRGSVERPAGICLKLKINRGSVECKLSSICCRRN